MTRNQIITTCIIALFSMTMLYVSYTGTETSDVVVYKTNTLGLVEGQYLVISKDASVENALQAILDGDVAEVDSNFFYNDGRHKGNTYLTSMKKELGTEEGFIYHFVFQKSYSDSSKYEIKVQKVDTKNPLPVSIPSLDSIPIVWFGWWGESLSSEMKKIELP